MADENSKKYLDKAGLSAYTQQLKNKLDETYSTFEYVNKTDDFIFAELIESQNHLKATNSQMATNLLELGNPLYQQQLAEEGKAGRFCFNIENDISDYYTGTFMHILFLDSNDKAVLYRTGRTASDSNMQISISNGVLPSGTIFNGTCRITKNKIYEYGESITTVESVGKSCVMISIPIASNTEAIINELKTLKVKVLLTKPNFLTFDNNNEFVPTKDYHPTTKKYVDDHFITDIYEDALVITAEEMNSSNNGGRGIYIDKIKTLDPAGFNVDFIYYGYYKDAVAVLTYSTQFNMFYCNRMDKNGSQSIGICMGAGNGNLIPMNNGTQDVKDYQFTEDLIIRKRILLSPNTTATKGYVDDAIVELMDSNSVNDYEIAKVNAKVSSIYNTKMQVLDGKFTDNVTYYTDADYSVTPQIGAKYAINIQKIIDGIGVNDVFTTVFKYKANGEDYTDSYTFETGISTGTIVSVELTMAGGTVDALFRINAYKEYNSDISLVDSEHCSVYITFSKYVSVELIDEIVNSMDLSVFLGSLNVLTLNNKEAYTPATDYQPATKKYVDDKTEILPVKNNYVIFEDAIPVSTEAASTYGTGGGGGNINNFNIFDNLQNTDMIVRAMKFNLTISFNDGTEDITENIIVDADEQIGFSGFVNDFYIDLTYDANYNLIEILVVKEIETDSGWEQTFYTITKATFICSSYSNLLKNTAIESIKYKKITQVPEKLSGLNTGTYKSLDIKQYVHLYDNSFVWDMNKINERLDETSGVTENTTATTVGGRVIKVNQKDSEGIGFGQLVPINNKHPLKIFFKAGKDVIVKVYNPNTKELISTINSDIRDPFNYTESGVYTSYLTGLDNIFVAFTIKDNTTENSTNRFIHDLVVTDSESLLKKEEILTKANTKEYVPTADYHPATKKYVDENNRLPLLSSILKKNEDGSLYKHNNMYHCLDFDLIPKDATVTYYDDISTKNVLNATFLLIWKDDNAISQVFGLRSTYPIIRIGYRTSQQLLNFTNTFHSINYNFETNEKTTSELYSLSSRPSTSAVLTKTNTTEYTPTDDYHPATKKYVDDLVNNSKEDLTEEDIDTMLSDIFGTIE